MKMLKILLSILCFSTFLSAEGIVGFWKSVDENSGNPQSVVAIYEHEGKYYGRIVVTFNEDGSFEDSIMDPKNRAPGVKGNPYYSGLDIIWGLQPDGTKYTGGEIMDPEKGRIYDVKIWPEGEDLIVRGELLFIGRNQTWPPAEADDFPEGFQKPDLKTLVPVIPEKAR